MHFNSVLDVAINLKQFQPTLLSSNFHIFQKVAHTKKKQAKMVKEVKFICPASFQFSNSKPHAYFVLYERLMWMTWSQG
jgi:hypothetical protein